MSGKRDIGVQGQQSVPSRKELPKGKQTIDGWQSIPSGAGLTSVHN